MRDRITLSQLLRLRDLELVEPSGPRDPFWDETADLGHYCDMPGCEAEANGCPVIIHKTNRADWLIYECPECGHAEVN